MSDYQIYTNQADASDFGEVGLKPTDEENARLKELARRHMEIATSEDMRTKKVNWKALRDLKPNRPMILFETISVAGFITEGELTCVHPFLRNVEKTLLQGIKQYEVVKDDVVLEEYYRIAWRVIRGDYGVKIEEHHAENSMGYMSNFPLQTPEDLKKLKERTFLVDKARTLELKHTLEEIFGDIMPVVVGNYDNWFGDVGYTPFCGNNAPVLTMDLFKLVGNENMMFWPFDYPDALKELTEFLSKDRKRFLAWLKEEGILALNTDNQFAGPSGYGYVSDLPSGITKENIDFKDCWTWCESQETNLVSPQMFDELFLPYLADYCNNFGLVSYGCCEPLDDRIEYIKKAIPKLRTVSVSGWNNFEKMAEALGKDYVYCRKPNPTYISGKEPNWEGAKKDISRTWDCTKDKVAEFIVRDVYDVAGNIDTISKWVEMAKKIIGM